MKRKILELPNDIKCFIPFQKENYVILGYNTGEIRRRKILGESTLQKIRDGKLPSWNELNKLCNLLGVHPVDLLEYIPDESQGRTTSDLSND